MSKYLFSGTRRIEVSFFNKTYVFILCQLTIMMYVDKYANALIRKKNEMFAIRMPVHVYLVDNNNQFEFLYFHLES